MNAIKEKSKAAFNRQAATYDEDMKGQHARSLYPVLLEELSHIPFQSALDLGCGTGEMLKLILQEDTHKELCGIDLSEKMLAVAKSKLPEQVKLILGDSTPFLGQCFRCCVLQRLVPSLSCTAKCIKGSIPGIEAGRHFPDGRLLAAPCRARDHEFLYAA